MYRESSISYPENSYALTKWIGEYEVNRLPEYLIIRTNFIAKKKRPYSRVLVDIFGTYLFAQDVSQVIKDVQRENMYGYVHILLETRKCSCLNLLN